MHVITDERCAEYGASGHPERPARILASLRLLRGQKDLEITWTTPLEIQATDLERAHTPEFIRRVREATEPFDGDTPNYKGIYEHACRSVGGALRALELARKGKPAFSLLRPPGHHATPREAMGFCYFNSIAIAVLAALDQGFRRVAVYDFDVHHGNGTEAIVLEHPQAFFYSIHQHPCYPGTGTHDVGSNCFNYPVRPATPRAQYRKVLSKALEDLKRQNPDLLAVSAGFDAYARDPLAQETLETEDYYWLGNAFRSLGVPVISVLEGGYSNDLPNLILAYLRGLDGAPANPSISA